MFVGLHILAGDLHGLVAFFAVENNEIVADVRVKVHDILRVHRHIGRRRICLDPADHGAGEINQPPLVFPVGVDFPNVVLVRIVQKGEIGSIDLKQRELKLDLHIVCERDTLPRFKLRIVPLDY